MRRYVVALVDAIPSLLVTLVISAFAGVLFTFLSGPYQKGEAEQNTRLAVIEARIDYLKELRSLYASASPSPGICKEPTLGP